MPERGFPHGVYELDTAVVDAAFIDAVMAISPSSVQLARRVRERIGPDRYALEWNLPCWIGSSLQVAPSVCLKLAIGNVIGLAALRLRDDLEDGDIDAEDMPAAHILSEGLLDGSLAVYRALFPSTSSLWPRVSGWLAEWQAATREAASAGHAQLLTARAAPLKISAYAVFLLGERNELFPTAERCLDGALEAMVLFDHLCDWQEDIQASRWNAFVAHAYRSSPVGDAGPVRSSRVYVAILSTDAVATYADEISSKMRDAVALAQQLGIVSLGRHLAELNGRLERHSLALLTHYRELAERATALFGSGKESGNGSQ